MSRALAVAAAACVAAASPRVVVVNSTTSVHVDAAGVTTVRAVPVGGGRPAAAAPGCVAFRVGDAHAELGNTDDVVVERCGPPPGNGTGVAVCAPTAHGPFLGLRGGRWVARWFAHYRSLGAAHAFVYAAAPPAWAVPGVTVVEAPFLARCAAPVPDGRRHGARCPFAANRSLMYWGQNFVLNDCLARGRAAGFAWVLSVDVDEFLEAPRGLAVLLDGADVATFGSAVEDVVPCPPPHSPPPPCAPPAPPRDPTCAHGCADCGRCLRNRGRRKHAARAGRALFANVHFVAPRACRPPCAVRDVRTDDGWLRHFSRPSRPTPLFDGATDRCPRCAPLPHY